MVAVVASQHLRTIRGPLVLPNIWEARWLFRSKWKKKKKRRRGGGDVACDLQGGVAE